MRILSLTVILMSLLGCASDRKGNPVLSKQQEVKPSWGYIDSVRLAGSFSGFTVFARPKENALQFVKYENHSAIKNYYLWVFVLDEDQVESFHDCLVKYDNWVKLALDPNAEPMPEGTFRKEVCEIRITFYRSVSPEHELAQGLNQEYMATHYIPFAFNHSKLPKIVIMSLAMSVDQVELRNRRIDDVVVRADLPSFGPSFFKVENSKASVNSIQEWLQVTDIHFIKEEVQKEQVKQAEEEKKQERVMRRFE